MKTLGYFTDEITGYYGSVTQEAVTEFEKVNKLDQDGILTPEDLKLMFSDKVKMKE